MRTLLFLLLLTASTFAQEMVNVTLAWDANPEPDIAFYRLYYGTQPGVYTLTVDTDGKATQVDITVNKAGYYYAVVTAINTSNLESLNSAELSFSATGNRPSPPKNVRRVK